MTAIDFDARADAPFDFMDYEGLVMPTGLSAANLREFLELVRVAPLETLHHHLNRACLRHRFEVWDYPNDFAHWAAECLEDAALAEKLSVLDPFAEADLERAREAIVEVVEEHLDRTPMIPWARRGLEFHFSAGHYLALSSGLQAWTLGELRDALAAAPLNSIYFHFYEARLRGPGDDADDFSRWIADQFGTGPIDEQLRRLDFYFFSLEELRRRVVAVFDAVRGERG